METYINHDSYITCFDILYTLLWKRTTKVKTVSNSIKNSSRKSWRISTSTWEVVNVLKGMQAKLLICTRKLFSILSLDVFKKHLANSNLWFHLHLIRQSLTICSETCTKKWVRHILFRIAWQSSRISIHEYIPFASEYLKMGQSWIALLRKKYVQSSSLLFW